MCQLTLLFSFLLFNFLLAPGAMAQENKLTYQYAFEEIQLADAATQGHKTSLSYDGEELFNHYSLSATFSMLIPEYLGVNKYDKKEFWGDANITYAHQNISLSLGGERNISSTPFPKSTFWSSLTLPFNNKATLITMGHKYKRTKNPPLLNRKADTITSYSLNGDVQQVISSRLKTIVLVQYTLKSKDHPQNYLIGNKWALGLSSNYFVKLGYKYSFDNKYDRIIGENGHFKSHTFESELTYEPIFDFLISVSYYLIVEDESRASDGSINRVAFDQYGLGIEYPWNYSLKTSLKSAYVYTNNNAKSFNVWGALKWTL